MKILLIVATFIAFNFIGYTVMVNRLSYGSYREMLMLCIEQAPGIGEDMVNEYRKDKKSTMIATIILCILSSVLPLWIAFAFYVRYE